MNVSRTNVGKCGESVCPGYALTGAENKAPMHRRHSQDKKSSKFYLFFLHFSSIFHLRKLTIQCQCFIWTISPRIVLFLNCCLIDIAVFVELLFVFDEKLHTINTIAISFTQNNTRKKKRWFLFVAYLILIRSKRKIFNFPCKFSNFSCRIFPWNSSQF